MTDAADPILGMELDAAIEKVLDREADVDAEQTRSTLETVTDDGVVTRSAINAAVGETAQYVATPENRLDLVEDARESARTAAEPVCDLDVVRVRFDQLEERYRTLQADLDALLNRLDALVNDARDPANVLEIARRVEDTQWSARDLHGRIEDLREDFESFERWATDSDTRLAELNEDADAVAARLDSVEETASEIESGNAMRDGRNWATAMINHRLIRLLLTDLENEHDALAAWPEADVDSEFGDRLATLRERYRAVGERLATASQPDWRDRYGDRLDTFDAELSSFNPPINWGAVAALVQEHAPNERVGN
ncbi:MAG: hypothetical protein ABEH64_02660 [Salinirussus sp.]